MHSAVGAVDGGAALPEELAAVEQEVLAALADLHAPFAQLVQGQWRRSFPLVRAAFVLTAGAKGAAQPPDLRRKRIYLAAAMETLRLALGVHTQLLAAPPAAAERPYSDRSELDRSLLGSTVLAGDFCFSRSAGLAAKTGSPAIVDLFAAALQRVSEGALRHLFRPAQAPYDADRDLCLSGVAAAGELVALPAPGRDLDQRLGAALLDAYRGGTPLPAGPADLAPLPPDRRAAWQALAAWLTAQPPSSPPAHPPA